jgi:hypothetical protein
VCGGKESPLGLALVRSDSFHGKNYHWSVTSMLPVNRYVPSRTNAGQDSSCDVKYCHASDNTAKNICCSNLSSAVKLRCVPHSTGAAKYQMKVQFVVISKTTNPLYTVQTVLSTEIFYVSLKFYE